MFVLAYDIAPDAANTEADIKDNRNYFLPWGNIEIYNVLIMEEVFMINPLMI